MSVERVLPKTLDYTDVLPLAVESKSRRRTFFPTNGAEFSTAGNNIIRIDLSADALLDTQHSYLRFTMTATAGTAGLDPAGGHAFISRLRVEQSGTILEDIQSYNKLMGAIVLPCQASSDYEGVRTLTEGQRTPFSAVGSSVPDPIATALVGGAVPVGTAIDGVGSGTNGIAQMAAGDTHDFCIPLNSGLLNCEKLIPLMLMSAPLTIELELASPAECVAGAAACIPTIQNVRYVANLVEVGNDVGQQLRMLQEMSGGVLTLTGQTYRHFSGTVTAGTSETNINIPARVKSMKSIFFNMPGLNAAGNTAASFANYDVGTGIHSNVDSFQFKIGSVTYPPTPVRCQFGTQSAAAISTESKVAGETVLELEKAWGNVGSRMGLGSKCNASMFYTIPNIRAIPPVAGNVLIDGNRQRYAPFGLDMEAFQRVAIESGVNTADRSLPISLILTHGAGQGGVNAIASQLDAYVLADALFYINSDGSMSVSV
tara:strand:- start:738 stop:2192 length:1455 start_codon:yes stop_codon:yes gene_type:complete